MRIVILLRRQVFDIPAIFFFLKLQYVTMRLDVGNQSMSRNRTILQGREIEGAFYTLIPHGMVTVISKSCHDIQTAIHQLALILHFHGSYFCR